jgi:hypothetical protein
MNGNGGKWQSLGNQVVAKAKRGRAVASQVEESHNPRFNRQAASDDKLSSEAALERNLQVAHIIDTGRLYQSRAGSIMMARYSLLRIYADMMCCCKGR